MTMTMMITVSATGIISYNKDGLVTCGYVELSNDVLWDAIEILDQCAEGVAVSSHDHSLARFDTGMNKET